MNVLVVKTKNVKLGSSNSRKHEADKEDKGKKVDEKRHGKSKKSFLPCFHYKKKKKSYREVLLV